MYVTQASQRLSLESIQPTLDALGIETGAWDADALQAASSEQADTELSPQIQSDLNDLMARRHYASYDVVRLKPDTPDLAQKLAAFEAPHYHTDDEVRVCIEGEGIFTIYPSPEPNSAFDIVVEPGDLIVVPAETMHSFTLTPQQRITAIRVFKENPKWKALYAWPTPPVAQH